MNLTTRLAGDTRPLSFRLNGTAISKTVAPAARLSEVLREACGARDVKVGCNAGDCGACTVLVDGEPVCACMTSAAQAEGREIETVSGLTARDPTAQKLAESFLHHGAAQCGICTPGMMVTATALLRNNGASDAQAIEDALGGVLCRCTGYRKIVDAVLDAGGPAANAGDDDRVGAAIPRVDGRAKLSGSERFGDDVAPVDALGLRVLRAPFHHASFTFGDLTAYAGAKPGVDLILTANDIPGRNCFGVIPPFADQPVFAEQVARFKGEAVAAVVGDPEVIAALDLDAFPVTWTELPAVLDVDAATATDAPQLHPTRTGNVMCTGFVSRGDAARALGLADLTVQGDFETSFVEHACIEPEAGFARRVGDRIEIHACTQAPFMDRDSIAEIMGLPPKSVRIVPTGVGGGFGSKLDLSLQPYVALAAWRLNRPVRIAYSRIESMQSTTKRHPAKISLKVGATRDGRLSGFDFRGRFNTGAYASWGPTVANRVPVHASGPYVVPDYRAQSWGIHTHCVPSGAFRGFGVPQSAVAQESLFDELADKLGLDPLEFRIANALGNGQPTVTGQVFAQGVGIKACFEALRPHWQAAREEAAAINAANPAIRRGVGVAGGWYGCGNTSLPNPSTIKAGLTADGRVVLHQGAVDIGQGANTVIAQIFATALGVPTGSVTLVGADTDVTPDAGKTSASRQTFVSGNAARLTGEALRAQILRLGNVSGTAQIVVENDSIRLVDGAERRNVALTELTPDAEGYVLRAEESYDPPTRPLDENGQGEPYAVFGYAAHMVELDVDTALGTVKLRRFVAAHDVGKAINPVLVEGQVQGGIAQGVGMALMEEFIPGRTENLHDYLIPTFGDMPPVETLIVEEADAHGPYGAKGLGEHVLIPTAPAILNAIRAATGARVRRLPATPERVLAAIRAAQNEES